MTEQDESPQTKTTTAYVEEHLSKRNIVALLVVVVLLVGGTYLVLHINKTRQEKAIAAARSVSDKALVALEKRNGAEARKLGTKEFQAAKTDKDLTTQFKTVEVATSGAHHLTMHMVRNGVSGQTIYFVYAYDRLKVPYYVRVGTLNENGTWRVSNITGNLDESKLYVP